MPRPQDAAFYRELEGLPEIEEERLREFSKPLFGSATRLPVAELIALKTDEEEFTVRDLAEESEMTRAVIRKELAHFESAGLLERSCAPHSNTYLYKRQPGAAFWELIVLVTEEARAERDPSVDG